MDETDFQAKTKRFLENMEKLRKEIHEEHVTKKFEEELIDEGGVQVQLDSQKIKINLEIILKYSLLLERLANSHNTHNILGNFLKDIFTLKYGHFRTIN